MKKLFVLFVIAASIGIYTQCNNNTETITIGSDELIGRTLNSDCDYNTDACGDGYTDTTYVVPVLPDSIGGVPIPDDLIEPDCKLGGIFTYYKCPDDKFLFTDYLFFIPPQCNALNDFMDGLNSDDYAIVYDFLSSLAQNLGMQAIIQNYANEIDGPATVIANVYEPSCYKVCKMCDYSIDPGGPDYPLKQRLSDKNAEEDLIEYRGGKCINGTWVFTKLKCGTGCCITEITYKKNDDGVMEVINKNVTSSGGCEGGNTSNRCGIYGEIVKDCTYSCN